MLEIRFDTSRVRLCMDKLTVYSCLLRVMIPVHNSIELNGAFFAFSSIQSWFLFCDL